MVAKSAVQCGVAPPMRKQPAKRATLPKNFSCPLPKLLPVRPQGAPAFPDFFGSQGGDAQTRDKTVGGKQFGFALEFVEGAGGR